MQTTYVQPATGHASQPLCDARNALPSANGTANDDRALLDALANSKIYHDYEQSFSEATGLPVSLRPTESWQLPLHGKRHENPFCQIMTQKSRACAACLQVTEYLSQRGTQEPQTATCPVGMCDTAVPVRLGNRLEGFLQTGQVFRKKPSQTQFERTAELVTKWGFGDRLAELK